MCVTSRQIKASKIFMILCRSKLNGRINLAGRFFPVFDRGQNNCYFDSAVINTNMRRNKFLQHRLVLTGTILFIFMLAMDCHIATNTGTRTLLDLNNIISKKLVEMTEWLPFWLCGVQLRSGITVNHWKNTSIEVHGAGVGKTPHSFFRKHIFINDQPLHNKIFRRNNDSWNKQHIIRYRIHVVYTDLVIWTA